MFKALQRHLSLMFRRKPNPFQPFVIHKSFFRGWPRAPSIELKTFPLIIQVSCSPTPTHLPIDVVSYTFYLTDEIRGIQRATYIIDIDFDHTNAPGFIWVFLIN